LLDVEALRVNIKQGHVSGVLATAKEHFPVMQSIFIGLLWIAVDRCLPVLLDHRFIGGDGHISTGPNTIPDPDTRALTLVLPSFPQMSRRCE
jgi:hypothetical protein